MKTHQKINLGFLGTYLLLCVLGFVALNINKHIQNHNHYLIKNSVEKAKYSKEMADSLLLIQAASEEILLEKFQQSKQNNNQSKIPVDNILIKTELANFKNNLDLSKKINLSYTETNNSNSLELQSSQQQEIKLLNSIEQEYLDCQTIINNYLDLTQKDLDRAYRYLEDTLEPQIRNNLLPLVKAYRDDALQEMATEAENIKLSLIKNNIIIIVFSLLTILISMCLGSWLSNYVKKTTVSKSYLNNIVSSMLDSLIVITTDGTIQKVNQATLKMLGYKESELINQNISLILADGFIKLASEFPQNFLGNWEITYLTKKRKKIPVAFSSSLLFNEGGDVQGIVCVAKDITEKYTAEKALRESEERYALASRAANDGLWDWNLNSNQIYFSPRWKSMLGYEDKQISSNPEEWFSRVHPDYIEQLTQQIIIHIQNNISHFEMRYPILCKDGHSRWMLCRGIAVEDEQRKVYRIVGSQTDITQSTLAEEKLRHDALHDSLTGLPNRNFFLKQLEKSLKISKENRDYCFAVLFLDLDRFKVINDSLGHLVGDELLIEFVNRIKQCLKVEYKLARLGGDEFVILMEAIQDIEEATKFADRLQTQLEKPFKLGKYEVFITASIGIVLNIEKYQQIEDILRDAHTAMYQAKASGKACYKIFEANMHREAMTVLELENDLRRALERSEFQVLYQPIVKLSNCQIIGFEALVRWQHPEKGLIGPAKFIPLAEETRLIVPIGWWVMEEACRQLYSWQQKYSVALPMTVNINLSPLQLEQLEPNDIVDRIEKILHETGLEPNCLKLEITESTIIGNIDQAQSLFTKLKSLGIKLSMDDFGTRNSSLNCLHRLPVDTIKIDRSFIGDLNTGNETLELIQTIINLAKNMNIQTIAEGVETSEQLTQLKQLNCEYGQGYFFSKPVNTEGAEILISTMGQLIKLTKFSKLSGSEESN